MEREKKVQKVDNIKNINYVLIHMKIVHFNFSYILC